jgi:hypothetical protein
MSSFKAGLVTKQRCPMQPFRTLIVRPDDCTRSACFQGFGSGNTSNTAVVDES